MLEKIEILDNSPEIKQVANKLFDIIIKNKKLKDNDKILVVDLLNAMINNELYKGIEV